MVADQGHRSVDYARRYRTAGLSDDSDLVKALRESAQQSANQAGQKISEKA